MAMVVDAFAPYVCKLLQKMAKEEAGMLLGAHGEIKKLEQMLGDLKAVLADAERKRITEETVQRWVGELKDVMYDALDITDLCQIKADEQLTLEEGCKPLLSFLQGRCGFLLSCMEGFCTPPLFCLRDPLFAHDIGRKIKALNEKLEDISRRKANFRFISSYEDRVVSRVTRKTSPVLVQSDVVGEKIENDTEELVEVLMKENQHDDIPVVAIVGVGGIGKTTLAKKIYHDEKIEDNCTKRVWVCISKDFDEVKILQNIIHGLEENHGGDDDKSLLVPKLQNAVRGKKLLLVLDDVWSPQPWNKLLRDPLRSSAHGSRVVVTTRNQLVAREMKVVHCHHVEKLTVKDGWSLLKQVVSNGHDIEIEQLKDVGIEIIRKCDGLPLAIKVVGGLLCKKNRTRKDWLGVSQNPIWDRVRMPEEISNALYLSYEELPSHLKQCFLYCSLFPTNEEISRAEIIPLWIAEGFVQDDRFVQDDGRPRQLEDLATEYYNELVMQNLLEPTVETWDQGACWMHDVLRSFAHLVAKDEALLLPKGQSISTGTDLKLRRLCTSNEAELHVLGNKDFLRTLLVFDRPMIKSGDISSCLFSLRVLDLSGAKLENLPDSLCHLKYLRHLDLSWTDISTIPQDIENLKFLQNILLTGCKYLSQLPRSILKLYRLRYLRLKGTSVRTVYRGFGSLKNLVAVSGYLVHEDNTANDDWCSLQELGPLSELHSVHLEGLENATSSSVASRANLCAKRHLEDLKLNYTSKIGDDGQIEEGITEEHQQQIEEVLDELCPPSSLGELQISGYFGRRNPNWMEVRTLENLRWLHLVDYACCKWLPGSLCRLPYLKDFWIKRAPSIECIGHEFVGACDGIHPFGMPAVAPFHKLETLSFEGMVGWEEWDWEQHVQAMPTLRTLYINNCKLRCLPPGLAQHATALKLLILIDIEHLVAVENFVSVVELHVYQDPKLERIANLPNLKKLTIKRCPELKVLEDVPELRSIRLEDYYMETLPGYLGEAKLKELEIDCSLKLLKLIFPLETSPELIFLRHVSPDLKKILHIAQVKVYGREEDGEWKSYVVYTKESHSFKAYNIGTGGDADEEE